MVIQKKEFNAYELKVIALIFMTLDHINQGLHGVLPVPILFNILGRLAAPIFVFMVAEGIYHTHSRANYMKRLYLASLLMGIGNIFINKYTPQAGGYLVINNIFASMFLIAFFISVASKVNAHIKNKKFPSALLYLFLLSVPIIVDMLLIISRLSDKSFIVKITNILLPSTLFVEGGPFIVLLGIGFYLFRSSKLKISIFYIVYTSLFFCVGFFFDPNWSISLIFNDIQFYAIFAIFFILMYNNKKGKDSLFSKYMFYIYYPAHIYILTWIGIIINDFK